MYVVTIYCIYTMYVVTIYCTYSRSVKMTKPSSYHMIIT